MNGLLCSQFCFYATKKSLQKWFLSIKAKLQLLSPKKGYLCEKLTTQTSFSFGMIDQSSLALGRYGTQQQSWRCGCQVEKRNILHPKLNATDEKNTWVWIIGCPLKIAPLSGGGPRRQEREPFLSFLIIPGLLQPSGDVHLGHLPLTSADSPQHSCWWAGWLGACGTFTAQRDEP